MKDLILRKQIEDDTFDGNIKLVLQEKKGQIIFQMINKKIGSLHNNFHNGLTLNSLLNNSTNSYDTKLFVAKQLIENKLNGLLKISNTNKEVIFTITL